MANRPQSHICTTASSNSGAFSLLIFMGDFGVGRSLEMILSDRAPSSFDLREFVKTHVILAPLREFSRSRAASKIPFPGAQPGQTGEPVFFFILGVKIGTCALA